MLGLGIEAFEDEVAAYGDDFFADTRGWLDSMVDDFVRDPARRHLVVVGEPGVGKSTYVAHLAKRFGGPRYFTRRRRDEVGSIEDADPQTFVISIGLQLRDRYRDLTLSEDELHLIGSVEADTATGEARTAGIDVEEAHLSPFRRLIVEGSVRAGDLSGTADLAGVRIRRLYDSTVSISLPSLLREAITEPLARLAKVAPDEMVVLLVDGLDVGVHGAKYDLVDAIPTADNLRVIMTSRPGAHLARFADRDRVHLSASGQVSREVDSVARNRMDVTRYLEHILATDPAIAPAIAATDHPEQFVAALDERCDGNFLYLHHFFAALRADLHTGDTSLLRPEGVPAGILDFYRLMLAERIRRDVSEEVWLRLYVPVLGILAVARDSLTADQIAAFAGTAPEEVDVVVGSITQFLDTAIIGGRAHHRIYHASFAEWLTDDRLNREYPLRAGTFHRRIVDAYGHGAAPWDIDDWHAVDRYGVQHLAAHLGMVNPDGLARLLASYPYLEAKLAAVGFGVLLRDFEDAKAVLSGGLAERPINLLRAALRLAGQAVLRNPAELPTQLVGRLGGLPEEQLQHLVASARRTTSASWLEPIRPSLEAPGGLFRVSLRGHEGTPRSVAISADGRIGASAGNSYPDQTVRVWDLDEGEEMHVFREQASADGYTPIALTGDSRLLMTAYDTEVRLWDLATGTLATAFGDHGALVQAAAIAERSPIAATGDADGIVLLWNLQRRELIIRLRSEPGGIRSLALTPDGRRLAVLTDAALEVWDTQDAVLVRRRAIEARLQGQSLSLSEDSTSVMFDGQLWLVPANDIRTRAQEHVERTLAITVDGDRILTSGPDNQGSDARDLHGRRAWSLPDCGGPSSAGAVSRDGRWALTAYYDHSVVAWDLDPQVAAANAASAPEPIWRVVIAADGRHAATFAESRTSIWDLETGTEVTGSARGAEALDSIEAQSAIDAAIVDGLDAERVEADVRANKGKRGDRQRRSEVGLGDFVYRDFYRHRWAIVAGGHLALHWLQPTAKTSEAEEHPRVGAGRHNYGVEVVDVERREPIVQLVGHSMHIIDGAISADGRRAATGSIGRLVRVWDLPGGELLATLPAHRDPVSGIDVSGDGVLVVSASWDGSVRVWDVDGGRSVATFSGDCPMLTCAVTPDGARVVAGDRAGRVHLLRLRDARD